MQDREQQVQQFMDQHISRFEPPESSLTPFINSIKSGNDTFGKGFQNAGDLNAEQCRINLFSSSLEKVENIQVATPIVGYEYEPESSSKKVLVEEACLQHIDGFEFVDISLVKEPTDPSALIAHEEFDPLAAYDRAMSIL